MHRTLASTLALVALALPLTGCFEDVGDPPASSGDGDGDGDATGDGDGDPETSGGDQTTGDGDGDGDGDPDPGPQLLSSVPMDGDQNASREPYVFLHFDRPVSQATAMGRVLMSRDGLPSEPVVVTACPKPEPSCIAVTAPISFLPDGEHLGIDTPYQVTITAGFEDTEGNPTLSDQTVDYRTFSFQPEFFDDSALLGDETGGLAYDSESQALFLVGSSPGNFNGPRVRRIPLVNGGPGAATTWWELDNPPGGPYAYGLDLHNQQLFVSLTLAGRVVALDQIGAPLGSVVRFFEDPGLPPPHESLLEVTSVVRSEGGITYFSRTEQIDGSNWPGILAIDPDDAWSVFNSGANLWNGGDVMLAIGRVGGTEFLFAASGSTIYKFRTSDGVLAATYEIEVSDSAFDLEVDSEGRLWRGGQDSGVRVYDVSQNDEIVELAQRGGVTCGRMALRETLDLTEVYCTGFRRPAVISRIPVEL